MGVSVTQSVLQVYYDLQFEEPCLKEGTSQVHLLKEEQVIVVKYEGKKVNFFLSLTKHHAMKMNWGNGGTAPRILNTRGK
jgi:hypothetical protein